MKKIPLTLVFVMLFCCNFFAQENSEFYFKSVSAGIGIVDGSKLSGGMNFNADGTLAYNQNLFSLSLTSGSDLNLIGDANRNFFAADVLYGREFSITRIFKIETHAGIGYFHENYKNYETDFQEKDESSIGIPIKVKALFYITDHFAMGFNPNVNFNSVETIYSGNLIFQYNFGK